MSEIVHNLSMYNYHVHTLMVLFFVLALVFHPSHQMLRALFCLVVLRYALVLVSYNNQIIVTIQVYSEQCMYIRLVCCKKT